MKPAEDNLSHGLGEAPDDGAPAALYAPVTRPGWTRPARWEWFGLAAVVGLFLAIGASLVLERAPLGHDEAVYALRARYFAGDHWGVGYWNDYRAPGLPLLMRLVWPLGATDSYLRLVVLLIGVAGIGVTWYWARGWFGPRAALLAAGLLSVMSWYVLAGFRIFVDAPGAAFGVATVAVFALSIGPERVSRWALLAVPLAAVATLNRYGAPTLIAGGLGVVALAHWRQVLRSWRLVGVVASSTAVVVGAILLVPGVTGSDQAPLRAFRDRQVAKGIGAFESYGDFNGHWPDVVGWPVRWVVVAGLLLTLVALVKGEGELRLRVAAVLGVLVASYVLLNAGLAQGFPQYLVPLLPFVAIATAAGLAPFLDRWRLAVLLPVVAVLLLWSAWSALEAGREAADEQRVFTRLEDASSEIGRRSEGDCVVLTSYAPQVGWYSGCATTLLPRFGPGDVELRQSVSRRLWTAMGGDVAPDAPVYWLLAERGKRPPDPEVEAALRDMTQAIELTVGTPGDGTLQFVEVGYLGRFGEVAAEPEPGSEPGS